MNVGLIEERATNNEHGTNRHIAKRQEEAVVKFCANTWSAALKVSLRIHNSRHKQCRVIFKTLSDHI